jgi:hypothetical protein
MTGGRIAMRWIGKIAGLLTALILGWAALRLQTR